MSRSTAAKRSPRRSTCLLDVVDEVVAVEEDDVVRAKDLLLGTRTLSSRDAVHVAVMVRQGIGRIMSFDAGFDRVPGITRIGR